MSEPREDLESLKRRIRTLEADLARRGADSPPADSGTGETDAHMTELLLDKAMRMASVGVWSVEIATGELTWSDEVFRIHELPIGSPPSVEEAVAYYAPEARVAIESALERLLSTGDTYDIELPLVTAKNNRIWVRGIGDVERDAGGKPKRLYGVFQEITTQVTLAQEREKARETAEHATRATSQFLSTMSHEIRTPLNGILGMAQILEQGTLNSEQRSHVDAIRSSGASLLSLLNDTQEHLTIEGGKLAIEHDALDRATDLAATAAKWNEGRPGSGAPLTAVPHPTRVLVVEDNPVNQVVARKLVESLGSEVTLACNGDEGVDALFAADFDIVLMDCQMPVLDGYEATRRLRRMESESGRPHVPVIAMTANAMDGDRERCLDAGMDDYLPKPVDRQQLADIICRWVDRPSRSVA